MEIRVPFISMWGRRLGPGELLRALAVAFLALGGMLAASASEAQQILIDRGARVEGLWVFPSALDENHYYYVPSSGRLATNEAGRSEPRIAISV